MSVAQLILFGLLATSISSNAPEENNRIAVYSHPTHTWTTDDILKNPLLVLTKVNAEEDKLNGYLADCGLSALASDPKGNETYGALRTEVGSALLIHPRSVTSADLQATTSELRLPGLTTLALLAASAVGIPWLLLGGSWKNSTNTTTFRHWDLQELFHLELSDHSVKILEDIEQLPESIPEDE